MHTLFQLTKRFPNSLFKLSPYLHLCPQHCATLQFTTIYFAERCFPFLKALLICSFLTSCGQKIVTVHWMAQKSAYSISSPLFSLFSYLLQNLASIFAFFCIVRSLLIPFLNGFLSWYVIDLCWINAFA